MRHRQTGARPLSTARSSEQPGVREGPQRQLGELSSFLGSFDLSVDHLQRPKTASDLGGAEGNRTPDLHGVNERQPDRARSQTYINRC